MGQWNTYQDLPNSELLRGFGHVDWVPLPGGGFGNPGDVAEVRADVLVKAGAAPPDVEKRIDWWLEEGGDEYVRVFCDRTNADDFFLVCLCSSWRRTGGRSSPRIYVRLRSC